MILIAIYVNSFVDHRFFAMGVLHPLASSSVSARFPTKCTLSRTAETTGSLAAEMVHGMKNLYGGSLSLFTFATVSTNAAWRKNLCVCARPAGQELPDSLDGLLPYRSNGFGPMIDWSSSFSLSAVLWPAGPQQSQVYIQ